MKNQSKKSKIETHLQQMGIGDTLNKLKFVSEHWEENDYFSRRSFDVIFCNSKKLFPEREFKVNNGIIERIC